MRERINKPRAFLSHARKDVSFIEKIERDLRRCQIDSWRDLNEIRDSESWQDAIFAEGLPICDVVLIYYTGNSIDSQMVSKEADAALLRQLSDKGVGFLPYVDSDKTRDNLRLDIKALQCRVWNDENYDEILPSVVAEIWRCYMERSIGIAIAQEKNRRLGSELELERLKSGMIASIFTPHEESEFNYIYSRLEGFRRATCSFSYPKGEPELQGNVIYVNYSFLRLLKRSISIGETSFNDGILFILEEDAKKLKQLIPYIEKGYVFYYFRPEQQLKGDLTTLGLLTTNFIPASDNKHTGLYMSLLGGGDRTIFMFSEKMYKFVKWIDFNEKIRDEPETEFVAFAVEDD